MRRYRILRWGLLKIIYPLSMLIGSLIDKERLQSLIIRLNNRLVIKERIRAERVVVLLPHCLQIDDCKIRLTYNIRNCKGCGRCPIKGLISTADEFGLELFVATGGNLARKIVRDIKPSAIVAVACERDLSSGISDTYPLPVYGVPNERPFGPCLNTSVDLEKVKEAIRLILSP